jgi:hypothetical protein
LSSLSVCVIRQDVSSESDRFDRPSNKRRNDRLRRAS